MKNEKIMTAWDKMNPDNTTKEKMLRQLQNTLEADNRFGLKRIFKRFSLGFAASCILLLGTFGTTYAASPAFRDYMRSLLFPLYTSDEFVSIANGHLTGSFDQTDVLLSFLDRFNRSEFGNSVIAAMKDGYHYSLYTQSENRLQAFVDSNADGYCIVVYMERLKYKNTEGIWQITGYQILENAAAETSKNQLTPYSEPSIQNIIPTPQEDTSIQTAGDNIIIYNVNDKKNTASLAEEDVKIIRDILDNCERLDHIKGELFQYVIKINNISYFFDSKGNGMIAESENHQGIIITEKDLNVIMKLFKQYHISLDETEL